MDTVCVSGYFLGGNTYGGFHSLYGELTDGVHKPYLYVLKGGPGCGKSSFMRRVAQSAEAAGLAVEYVLCSGDPDSLDGVVIPELGAAIADGTSPHVLEPFLPGVDGSYIDLGCFYDTAALAPLSEEISAIKAAYSAKYIESYRFLAAAGRIEPTCRGGELICAAADIARLRAERIAKREFGRAGGAGVRRRVFIDAFTCRGRIFLSDTVKRLCGRLYVIDSDFGLDALIIDTLAHLAADAGLSVILCADPLLPERTAHLLIPELSLGFIGSGARQETLGGARRLHPDSYIDRSELRRLRPSLRISRDLYGALLSRAGAELAEAKRLHDELEALYNPHVSFDGVYERADKLVGELIKG